MSQGNTYIQRLSIESQNSSNTTKSRATSSSPASAEYSLPLAALRTNQTWLILSGQKINAAQATVTELERFFENAVNVIHQKAKPWSIFIRWHALNHGINAGTLRLVCDDGEYLVSKTEAFSSSGTRGAEEKASASGGQTA